MLLPGCPMWKVKRYPASDWVGVVRKTKPTLTRRSDFVWWKYARQRSASSGSSARSASMMLSSSIAWSKRTGSVFLLLIQHENHPSLTIAGGREGRGTLDTTTTQARHLTERDRRAVRRRDDRAERAERVRPEGCAERDHCRREEELGRVLRDDVAVADGCERVDGEVERERVPGEEEDGSAAR